MVFHSMRCFYLRAITGRAFFVESADCYFAPLIFLSKLFLQSKYPCPYFVGVNVLMCAMLKREGGKRGSERRSKRGPSAATPIHPIFFHSTLVFPLPHSHSPSLPFSVALFYECVWVRVRVCLKSARVRA